MGSEVQESKEKKVEGSEKTVKSSRKKMLGRKRAGKVKQQESLKKQRMKEDKESNEVEEVSEDDEGELMKHLVIKKDEDISIDAIPLATKLPVIIDYKLHKEGMFVHYQLIRGDGSSKRYSSMIRMLQGIDREDSEALWKIVKIKYSDIRLEDEFERVHNGNYAKWFGINKLEPKLYDGNVIKNMSEIVIPDSKETLMLAKESHSKMLLKQKDPMMLEKKVNTTPVDYAVLN
ncbi:hypothetical protein Tco_1018157 [Tanacetum coccineum]|uniref:Plus3 domain-containing protein n=1 Tax=Tanacetum coccineum TaxID=301880 RepID=A0ABQ5FTH3_9ASTR